MERFYKRLNNINDIADELKENITATRKTELIADLKSEVYMIESYMESADDSIADSNETRERTTELCDLLKSHLNIIDRIIDKADIQTLQSAMLNSDTKMLVEYGALRNLCHDSIHNLIDATEEIRDTVLDL